MQIGVIGINHKLADLKLREQLAKACQRYFGSSTTAHAGQAFVLLSTCNRTEIYFSSPNLADTHTYLLQFLRRVIAAEFDQKLYSYFGSDCFVHLCTVTAGLDSAILAETEIQGQVKAAYAKAVARVSLPKELHYLFQKSLKVSKTIRSKLPTERGFPDIEDAIFDAGKQLFQAVEEQKLLFVGASAINIKILNAFKQKKLLNITLCNRSDEKSRAFAEKLNVATLPWSRLSGWDHYDWIIFGTKAEEPLITSAAPCSNKLIIDLSVPRNVAPAVGRNPAITLWNIDQINRTLTHRQKQLKHTLAAAEASVFYEANKQVSLFQKKERGRAALISTTDCLTA